MPHEFAPKPEIAFGLALLSTRKDSQKDVYDLRARIRGKGEDYVSTQEDIDTLMRAESLRSPRAHLETSMFFAFRNAIKPLGKIDETKQLRGEVDRNIFPNADIPWPKDFSWINYDALPHGAPWEVTDALWGAKFDDSKRVLDIAVNENDFSISTAAAAVRVEFRHESIQKVIASIRMSPDNVFPGDTWLLNEGRDYLMGRHLDNQGEFGSFDSLAKVGLDHRVIGSLIGVLKTAVRLVDMQPQPAFSAK